MLLITAPDGHDTLVVLGAIGRVLISSHVLTILYQWLTQVIISVKMYVMWISTKTNSQR